jgi:hypothetical protein
MNLSSAGTNVNGGDDWGDAHALILTGTVHTVPTGLGYSLLTISTLWHRFLLSCEIRKRFPSSIQSVLGVLLRSSGVSAEEDTVDLEHAMVWRVWRRQILPLLKRDGRFETFGF